MKNQNSVWSPVVSVTAFFIGVILLWSFGKSWLNFESTLVFLAGLIGVVVGVLLVTVWAIRNRSSRSDK